MSKHEPGCRRRLLGCSDTNRRNGVKKCEDHPCTCQRPKPCCKPAPVPLTFAAFREANRKRLAVFKNNLGKRAHTKRDGSDWSPLEWAGAMCGEAGEAANVAKKFRRGDYSKKNPRHVQKLADELADNVAYADLLAMQFNIDLGEALRRKWNKTSKKIGYKGRL